MDRFGIKTGILSGVLWLLGSAAFAQEFTGTLEPPYRPSEAIRGLQFAPPSTIRRQAKGSDNWPITWADDGALYSAYGDGRGFVPNTEKKLSLGLARITGGPDSFRGTNIRSASGEQVGQGRAGIKASGMLMVGGVLYMLVRNADHDGRYARLAWSSDHGKSWAYSPWRFTRSFGCPTFLNFGKNYAGARDQYVYIYSPDETDAYKPADRMMLARVHRDSLRRRDAYAFYKGLDAQGRPQWTRDVAQRGAVFTFPGNCYRSGISYNAGLGRYLWCQALQASRDPRGSRFQGGFGIYEAPEPWGPWRTVYFTRDWDVGPGETASFPTKWMSRDGRTCYLVFSDDDSFSVRKVIFDTGR